MHNAHAAIVNLRSVRLEWPRSELPLSWNRALVALGPSPWTDAGKGEAG